MDARLTVVKKSKLVPGEKGLFAVGHIKRGAIVVSMNKTRLAPADDYDPIKGMPADSVIHSVTKHMIVYDATWKKPNRKPKWYRINHCQAEVSNLHAPELKNGHLVWVAKRNINPTEELSFTYQNAKHLTPCGHPVVTGKRKRYPKLTR